ncbi:hypothetical protein CsSME_00016915 [Camellia sinensis var. sinensis]
MATACKGRLQWATTWLGHDVTRGDTQREGKEGGEGRLREVDVGEGNRRWGLASKVARHLRGQERGDK